MRRREFLSLVGGGANWPLAVLAHQPRQVFRIAVAHPSLATTDMSETGSEAFFRSLFGELRRLGYTEGQNLIVERYSGQGRAQLFPELAREVVRTKPDLILVFARRLVQQFAAATTEIPIIVRTTLDPVGYGIADSLARPGRNLTGVTMDAGLSVLTKHIELLRIVTPNASRIGFLAPEEAWHALYGREMQEAARRAGVSLLGLALAILFRSPSTNGCLLPWRKQEPKPSSSGALQTMIRTRPSSLKQSTGLSCLPSIRIGTISRSAV